MSKSIILNQFDLLVSIFSCLIFFCYKSVDSNIIYLYLAVIIIELVVKIKKRINVFSPEYVWIIAFLLYFYIPFVFYGDGYFWVDGKFYQTLRIVFCNLLIYNISILVYSLFKASPRRIHYDFFVEKKHSVKLKNLMFLSFLIITIKTAFLFSSYNLMATAENTSSIMDLFFVPIQMASFILFSICVYCAIQHNILIKYKLGLYLFILFFILFDAIIGSKRVLFFDLSIIVYFYYQFNKKLPIKTIFVFSLLLLLYFPFALFIRINKVVDVHIVESISGAFSLVKDNSDIVMDGILGRINMLGPMTRSIQLTNKRELLNQFPAGNTIFPLYFMSFIPRFIWSGRPDSGVGGIIGYYLGFTQKPGDVYISISLIGEMFLNFKYFSYAIFAILGFIHMHIFKKLVQRKTLLSTILLVYFYLFVLLTGFESYFVVRYNLFLKNVIIMILFWIIVKPYIMQRGGVAVENINTNA